jgi:hypothetical protein
MAEAIPQRYVPRMPTLLPHITNPLFSSTENFLA